MIKKILIFNSSGPDYIEEDDYKLNITKEDFLTMNEDKKYD